MTCGLDQFLSLWRAGSCADIVIDFRLVHHSDNFVNPGSSLPVPAPSGGTEQNQGLKMSCSQNGILFSDFGAW